MAPKNERGFLNFLGPRKDPKRMFGIKSVGFILFVHYYSMSTCLLAFVSMGTADIYSSHTNIMSTYAFNSLNGADDIKLIKKY